MPFTRNIFIVTLLSLSLPGRAEQQQNGTFPTIVRIARDISNSTRTIATVMENTGSYIPEILAEIKAVREQGERWSRLAEKITSYGYICAASAIISLTGVSMGGLFILCRYLSNKYFVKPANKDLAEDLVRL